MTKWNDIKKEFLKDPEVKREYDKLEAEYQMARSIIQARIDSKMTQAELAKKAGISQVMIARLESGTSNSTIHTIHKVARALGKKIDLVNAR